MPLELNERHKIQKYHICIEKCIKQKKERKISFQLPFTGCSLPLSSRYQSIKLTEDLMHILCVFLKTILI